jgi:hypothetical protein
VPFVIVAGTYELVLCGRIEYVEDIGGGPTPTQYESPTQKLVPQSEDTAGFQSRNCILVMLKAVSIVAQVSPVTTSYHSLQVLIVPV